MKILIVQTSFLGDTVLSTPLIGALQARFPSAAVWFLGTPAGCELVRRDPLLAGVIPFDKNGLDRGVRGLMRKARELRAHRFDRVYAVQRSARTAVLCRLAGIPERIGFRSAALGFLYTDRNERPRDLHDVERNLALLGEDSRLAAGELRLFPRPRSEFSAGIEPELPSEGAYAVLSPGSVWATKRWDWQGYREVCERLLANGTPVVVVGALSERDVCERVCAGTAALNLCGRTTVDEFAGVIGGARLLVCNDSVALHIGSALKVPTVVIFCATSPQFGFGPWRNRAVVVEKAGLACKPCRRHGSQRCPTGTEACMRGVTAADVLQAAHSLGYEGSAA